MAAGIKRKVGLESSKGSLYCLTLKKVVQKDTITIAIVGMNTVKT